MTKYVKAHTKYILEQIRSNSISENLLKYHRTQILNIQHERLIHLIVLCLFTLMFAAAFAFFYFVSSFASLVLMAVFAVVEFFYVLHYYLLENTVQSWYRLENTMIAALSGIGDNLS